MRPNNVPREVRIRTLNITPFIRIIRCTCLERKTLVPRKPEKENTKDGDAEKNVNKEYENVNKALSTDTRFRRSQLFKQRGIVIKY